VSHDPSEINLICWFALFSRVQKHICAFFYSVLVSLAWVMGLLLHTGPQAWQEAHATFSHTVRCSPTHAQADTHTEGHTKLAPFHILVSYPHFLSESSKKASWDGTSKITIRYRQPWSMAKKQFNTGDSVSYGSSFTHPNNLIISLRFNSILISLWNQFNVI